MSLGIGIVGTGRIAADYLQIVDRSPALHLAGIVDVRQSVAAAVAERYRCRSFASVAELVEKGAEAVIVSVPPSQHAQLCREALAAGAHVLCEKPFTLDREEARELCARASSLDRVLTMSAKFRYVPDVVEAKARIEGGAIGQLALVRNVFASEVAMARRWNSNPELSGGGVWVDNGTHSADLLRYLAGPITWVQLARGPSFQALPVEETVHAVCGHESGAVSHVDLSWSLRVPSEQYCSVHGEDGTIELGWNSSTIERANDRSRTTLGDGYDKTVALAAQVEAFAARVRGEEAALLEADDVFASVAVVEAGYESLAGGGCVVSLA